MKAFICATLALIYCGFLHSENARQDFDSFVQSKMEQYEVPGLAIGIVKDDKVILLRGYGYLEKGRSEKVTKRTLFAIGSCTKAIAAASLAILVDEGVLTWDKPASAVLSNFKLSNDSIAQHLSAADMLSHRSGLDACNMFWYGTGFNRSDLLYRLRFAEVQAPFRDSWIYNNLLYMAAGEMVPALTGKSWDDFVVDRIFLPLGMEDSGTQFATFKTSDNVALPHVKTNGGVLSFPHRNVDQIGPAGSVVSNVQDMAQWIRVNLNGGIVDGQRILSEKAVEVMQSPHANVPESSIVQGGFPFYGLGWAIQDYHGYKMVSHNGYLDGTTARIALLPEKGLGVVVLANLQCTPISHVIVNTVIDEFLGEDFFAWDTLVPHTPAVEKQVPALYDMSGVDLSIYTGVYHSEIYGEAVITLVNGDLHYHFHDFEGKLIPTGMDQFAFVPGYQYIYAPVKVLDFLNIGDEILSLNDKSMNAIFSK